MAKRRKLHLHPVDEQAGWRPIGGGEFPPVWQPKRAGEALECEVVRVSRGRFGAIWRVRDRAGAILCLPNHVALVGRLEEAGVGPGWQLRIQCVEVGSRTKGDYYEYDIAGRPPEGLA